MSSNNSSSPTDANAKENGIMVTATAYLRKLQRETPPEELRKMLDNMAKERRASPEERVRRKEARARLVAARERVEAHREERRAQRERDFEAGNQGPNDTSRPTMESTESQAERTEDRMPETGFFTGFRLSQQLGHGYVASGSGDYTVPFEALDGYSEYLPQSAALYGSDWILPWTDVREDD
ncbi:hypothetical protein HER10_EVM0002487 [Colletotrichum scovillei]|uniref:uncharacterized protein n=1 Tax=Colletotrichum scovillei TaxID=1209932 RepID=UPI0015C30AF6|nr:uncharacterized protein HER10_EVM0002487 [Colletotrichum scovillei]KAF4779285.1 hypothetical protein HER10_EVM0002487 [Colletotrichum scovillei]